MVSKRSGSMPANESLAKPIVRALRRSARLGSNKELMPRKEICAETTKPDWNKFGVPDLYYNEALEVYKEEHKDNTEFEVLNVHYIRRSGINHPEWKGFDCWAHLYFTAKPKNSDNCNVSPKHFLAELLYDCGSWYAKCCNVFEPSTDPGFKHECVICGDRVKIHPPHPGGYKYGGPPCRVGGFIYRQPLI